MISFLANAYAIIGDVYVMKDSLYLAENHYDTALAYFQKYDNAFKVAGVLTVLGNIKLVTNHTSKALQYYLQALKISKEKKIDRRLPYLYLNIGTIYFNANNINEAQNYYARALEGFEQVNDSLNTGRVLSSLGITYSNLKEHRLANDYYQRALGIFLKLNSAADIAESYFNISEVEKDKGSFDKAIEYLHISLKKIDEIDYHYAGPRFNILAKVELGLGANYLMLGDLIQAKKYLLDAFKIAEENGLISTSIGGAEKLLKIYERSGLFDSALYYHKIFKQRSEALINEENIKTLAAATFENKPIIERVIKELESDNTQKVWKEFEMRFQNVHNDFYKRLINKFPDLSPNELRLCAFLKLNLNTKEISSITHQSINSIDIARSRLRQKLGLSKEENLISFLAGF